jgi:hypothetical protein
MEESEGFDSNEDIANKNLKGINRCLDKAKDDLEKAKVTLVQAQMQLTETRLYRKEANDRLDKINALKRKAPPSVESFFIPHEMPSQLYQENEQIENIMSAPVGAPLSHKKGPHQFYVRSSYHSYYDQIMQRLFCQTKNEKNIISVTGSP